MISVPNSILIVGSTPYAKRGEIWTAHKNWFGKADAKELVWRASSLRMNPTLSAKVVAQALEDDPASARSEYLAEFRDDVATFVDREVVEGAVIADRLELPPGSPGLTNLKAAVDAAGGAGADSYCLAIAGRDTATGKAVLLCTREIKPPFSPSAVTAELASTIKSYGLTTALADRFGGSWPAEEFGRHEVTLTASKTSSEIFIDFLPALMSHKVELLDNRTAVAQIAGLERRVGRGRDHIAAAGNGHDDLALVIASACVEAAKEEFVPPFIVPYIASGPVPRDPLLGGEFRMRAEDWDYPAHGIW